MDAGNKSPLRIALLGAGIFATNAHVPVLEKHTETLSCVAVWSRHKSSAEELIASKPFLVANHCLALGGEDDLADLLQRSDIDAILMALPLNVQPLLVPRILQAGKHLLSEKPIAPTVAIAKSLVEDYYQTQQQDANSTFIWSVAENFRYEPAMDKMRTLIVQDNIGKPFLFRLTIRAPFLPNNRYLQTSWRKDPSYGNNGGLFVDAFVHAAAALRWILGEAQNVSAVTTSRADHIPGVDTMTAHATLGATIQGTMSVTYACVGGMVLELEVVGSQGSVQLQRSGPGYKVILDVTGGSSPDEWNIPFGGVEAEIVGFAAACRSRHYKDRNTPKEALLDLAFVEACLGSGKQGGAVVQV
jgi:predicted dehydrogenase